MRKKVFKWFCGVFYLTVFSENKYVFLLSNIPKSFYFGDLITSILGRTCCMLRIQ